MVIASLRVSKTVSFHTQTHNESEDWAHLPALIEKYITKEKVDIRRLRHVLHSDHGIVLKPHELSRLIKCYGISVPRGKRNVYRDCLAPPPSGPNDEWGIMAVTDVHPALGLVVFGIRDKFSQRQLALRVVPIEHSRDKRVPLALFLKSVKELGGIPHILLSDERTPSQLIASVQISLRKQYESVDDSNRASVLSSIKKARSSEIYWAKTFYQLFGQELADIGAWCLDYASQKAAGYDRFNPTHRAIARWLWAKITQHTLNKWCERNNHGVISNGTPDEAYRNPQKYGGEDMLVKLPAEEIMKYQSEETVAELFQFGSDAEVDLARTLYERVRPLEPRPASGWSTFQAMLSLYDTGRVVVVSAKLSIGN